jgi:hypothetical protein
VSSHAAALGAWLARAGLRVAVAGLPPDRSGWGRGQLAELDAVDAPGERLVWTLGGLRTVLRLRLRRWSTAAWLAGVAGSAALLGFLDWSPSDIANQATLLALLVTAGCLGFAIPGARLATGLILGSAVAVLHLTYLGAGVRLPYQMQPAGMLGALSLFVLVVPATVAALIGGAVRRRALPG